MVMVVIVIASVKKKKSPKTLGARCLAKSKISTTSSMKRIVKVMIVRVNTRTRKKT